MRGDDREDWWDDSMEALPIAVPIEELPTPEPITLTSGGLTLTYDPTPATDPPFAEGVTKGYLVWRMPDQALVADCVVMVDAEGMAQYEQTSEWRPTTIKEDE